MARITKEVLGRLLDEAMTVLDVSGKTLAELSGIDEDTISRIRKASPKAGKTTRSSTKRALERGLRLPEGYLDGDIPLDLEEYRRQLRAHDGGVGGIGAVREARPSYAAGVAELTEERARDILRTLEFTTNAQVSRPDLFTEAGKRFNRLGIIDSWLLQFRLRGVRIPDWVHMLHNEVITGEFR